MKHKREKYEHKLSKYFLNPCLFRVCSYGYSVVHKKEIHLSKILISVVFVFLVLNLPRLVIGIYEISR